MKDNSTQECKDAIKLLKKYLLKKDRGLAIDAILNFHSLDLANVDNKLIDKLEAEMYNVRIFVKIPIRSKGEN